MPIYSGVMIRKQYFEIEVEADNEDQARDLIMDAEIKNDSYETDWELFEGSITEVVTDIEKT
jgi:hypothetical protein